MSLPTSFEAWCEMEEERTRPMATMADAHREWHRNTGVPMGQPGCPQDACDPWPFDDDDDYVPAPLPPDIDCGHCGGRHANVETVHECAQYYYGGNDPDNDIPF
mgnify:CR=1 FL=1